MVTLHRLSSSSYLLEPQIRNGEIHVYMCENRKLDQRTALLFAQILASQKMLKISGISDILEVEYECIGLLGSTSQLN